MKLTVISLLLLISTVSALDFQISSPSSANLNEQFTVSLTADTLEIYDVKIFVQDINKDLLSEIYNDGWKSSFYYLKSVFPKQTKFEIKITKSSDKAEICARLRKSGKTSFDEKCNDIKIEFNEELQSNLTNNPPEKEINNKKEEIEEDEAKKENSQVIDYPEEENLSQLSLSEKTNIQKEKIILKTNNEIKYSTQNTKFKTTQYYIRNTIIYSFAGLCIIIIILLALKRL